MASYAGITLVGHLVRDPETKYTPSGTSITAFTVPKSKKDVHGNEHTTWWRCTCFGKRGEVIAQYFKKGDPILVQGEPSVRDYTKKDGSQGYSPEVIVNDFAFIKGRKDADHGDGYNDYAPKPGAAQPAAADQTTSAWADGADDIPF